MENYDEIIAKAVELSELINNHEVTLKYRESLEKMQRDPVAQKLLSDLILLGQDINESLSSGKASDRHGAAEIDLLKQEFEKNETVREHILAQREYLNLINSVQDKIKNPA